jgi:hypothetical protein
MLPNCGQLPESNQPVQRPGYAPKFVVIESQLSHRMTRAAYPVDDAAQLEWDSSEAYRRNLEPKDGL